MSENVFDQERQRLREQGYEAAKEILKEGKAKPGQLFVVGCSTSEILGGKIGKSSDPETAKAVFEGDRKSTRLNSSHA